MRKVQLAPYLQEPNYYRIWYQLAASMVNAELEQRRDRRSTRRSNDAVALADAAAAIGVAGTDTAAAAAETLVSEAQGVLRKLDAAEASRRGRFLRRRTPRGEKALRAFLEHTLLPSAELVLASALDLAEGEGAGGGHFQRVATLLREDHHLSYRVHYNAACYLSTAAWMDEDALASLADFQRALRLAQGSERGQLAHWAQLDPSLARLRQRQEPAFTEAVNLALSSLPDSDAPKSGPAVRVKRTVARARGPEPTA